MWSAGKADSRPGDGRTPFLERVLVLPPKLMDEEGRPEVQLLEPDEDTAAAWVRKRRFTSKKRLGPRSQDAQPQVRVQPG